MKHLLLILIFLVTGNSLYSQIYIDKIIDETSMDISFDGLNQPIHKVALYDSILWASDYGTGKVFKSIDNGKSFKEIAVLGSEYFESIQFLNEKIGFICGDYGFVYKTIDGGETWIEISPKIENRLIERYRNDSTKNQKPDGQFAAYYSMHFSSADTGFVSGFRYNPKLGLSNSYKSVFYSTNDGGITWNLLDTSQQHETIKRVKKEITSPFGYIQNDYFINKDISWRSKRSKNGTDILIKENYQTKTSDTLLLPKTDYNMVILRSIAFLSDNIGFVLGGSLDNGIEKAIIYSTIDGGNNWNYMESDMNHIHVAIENDQYLFILGKNGLMKRIGISKLIEKLSY
jgi:hypothetical protein